MRLNTSQVISNSTVASLITTSTSLCPKMANWEHQHPPRTSSRWAAPGLFMNFQVGVSFSNNDPPHTASIKYSSRNMQERMYRQHQDAHSTQHEPRSLMPENSQARLSRQQRARSLDARPIDPYGRGISAPSTRYDRHESINPVSAITPIHHTSSMPLERANRPLPAAPSRFRLGEDGLPWSTEPWYRCEEEQIVSPIRPTMVGIELEERRTAEDPQRVRELEDLHQAMMTVDSLDHDGWETWTWDSVGDIPRGPRSLGWAVSTEATTERLREALEPPPPPYVVSQWEQVYGRRAVRPRSALS